MKFIGVNKVGLDTALSILNERYAGNVKFNRCDHVNTQKNGREEWIVTLRTHSSKGPGHGRSVRLPMPWGEDVGGRNLATACWHVYGHFFDLLGTAFPQAEMITSLNADEPGKKRRCLIIEHGWADVYVHNAYGGQMTSEMCACEGEEYA